MSKVVDIYTDGSWDFQLKKAKWAFIVIEDDAIIYKNKGMIDDPAINEGQQIKLVGE